MKIDLSDQIYKWREEVVKAGYMPKMRRLAFKAAGELFSPTRDSSTWPRTSERDSCPSFPIFSYTANSNPWTGGNDREMVRIAKTDLPGVVPEKQKGAKKWIARKISFWNRCAETGRAGDFPHPRDSELSEERPTDPRPVQRESDRRRRRLARGGFGSRGRKR